MTGGSKPWSAGRDAEAKGARVLAGGHRIGNRGYYYPLTVLADMPDDARAMNEEPFGPLALINPVQDRSTRRSRRPIPCPTAWPLMPSRSRPATSSGCRNGVEVGNLSINHFVASIAETPFGGVKDSGYGREGGTEGLSCYTVVKNVSHKFA